MKRLREFLSLFWQFLKIGSFTFGGGLNIVAQIQRVYVDEKGALTEEDILDNYCVGKSIPGTMVTNVSFLVGYQLAGVGGGIACVLGLITTPTILLIFVALFYDMVKNNVYIAKAMVGVRAAVVPIIVTALLRMMKSSFPDWLCVPIAVLSFILFYFLNWNSLLIVLISAFLGACIKRFVRRGGGGQ